MSIDGMALQWPFFLLVALLLASLILITPRSSLTVPSIRPVAGSAPRLPPFLLRILGPFCGVAGLLLLGLAASRPYTTLAISADVERRNIILCVDVSRSMQARDFGTTFRARSRLEGVQTIAAEFVAARKDDRIGVVVFGEQAFLQVPLTHDHNLVLQMLALMRPGMAGNGTAIGDGLAASLKRLEHVPPESAAVILLSDGVSNSGRFTPLVVARVAADLGIRVHTIAIGGNHSSFLRQAEVDEETLEEIASMTLGQFFSASSIESLRDVHETIHRLEQSPESESLPEYRVEHFSFFLWPALFFLLSAVIVNRTLIVRIP